MLQPLPYFPARKGRAPPPTFPQNSMILMPMDKQNHFLGDFETINTRAPLFLCLEFNETEHRDAQWERGGVKVLKKHSKLRAIYGFLPVVEPSPVEPSKTAPNGAKAII